MKIVNRTDYNKIFKEMNLSIEEREKCIDIYHKNNWNRFTMHWDEDTKNDCPSYIDFFFDAKSMVGFLKSFLKGEIFHGCFMTSLYNERYKLKRFNDDVCEDIYDEFKTMLNSMGLKVNTNAAIHLTKEELIGWCDRISVGGFCGVSEYIIVIPELNLIIFPHHHMNYLVYTNDKEALQKHIRIYETEEDICLG